MDTATQTQNEETQDLFDGMEHYTFSPSISKRRMFRGKTYYVRSYFTGGKNFNETITRLAAQQAYKRNAG